MARPFGLSNAKRLSAMHVILNRSAPDNLPIGEMVCEAGDLIPGARRQMAVEQLRYLGTRQVVYLRAGTLDGETAFLIYRPTESPL
jgi:chaperone required for assembly of F1-ATPase